MWTLLPLFFLCPSYPARDPLSTLLCKVRASRITAVGLALRPLTRRSSTRKSCTMTSKQPASIQRSRLLLDCIPRRQIIGQHPPGSPGAHKVTQRIKHLPQRMLALRSVLLHQTQIWSHKFPFLIADITRIWLSKSFCTHPPLYSNPSKSA